MSEEQKEPLVQTVFKLDSDRRREIDGIRERMEDFLKSQIEVRHAMEMVVRGQDTLKERFETGTARTLKELKDSFDQFRVEWGQKKAEDEQRDKAIADVKVNSERGIQEAKQDAKDAHGLFRKISIIVFSSLGMGLTFAFIVWAFKMFGAAVSGG